MKFCLYLGLKLVTQTIKNLPAIWESQVLSLGWEDPLERAWQSTPVFLPGESPWTEEPGGLQSMESRRVRQDCTTKQSPAQQSIHYMDKREEDKEWCLSY